MWDPQKNAPIEPEEDPLDDCTSPVYQFKSQIRNRSAVYKNLAQSLLASLADFTGQNPYSRLYSSNYGGSIDNLSRKLMNKLINQGWNSSNNDNVNRQEAYEEASQMSYNRRYEKRKFVDNESQNSQGSS